MKVLNGIKATGTQNFTTTDGNGNSIQFTLYYRPSIQTWTADIVCGDFTLNGIRICTHLNLLQQYEKIINFGLSVITTGGGEPSQVNDFSTSRCQLIVLTADEVSSVSQYYKDLRDA